MWHITMNVIITLLRSDGGYGIVEDDYGLITVEIMDCDVTSLKRGRIPIVKVRWNSKRGPEFTWEREEYMESKYPQLFVDRVDDQTS
ncbi:hypothetical protein Tco_0383382 [Tanacetum coccineum]